jgi:hypothetical protein
MRFIVRTLHKNKTLSLPLKLYLSPDILHLRVSSETTFVPPSSLRVLKNSRVYRLNKKLEFVFFPWSDDPHAQHALEPTDSMAPAWLTGGTPKPCLRGTTITKQHIIDCLHLHSRLSILRHIQDSLSYILHRFSRRPRSVIFCRPNPTTSTATGDISPPLLH